MNNPKVSVIIPVYNTEIYLRKCLESVVNQTLRDIEIIIINDCTIDNSEEIVWEYQNKDDRIVYVRHNKNLGLGGVRNTGINAAKGEYQWHIDSDDFIDVNACEILYATAKNYDVEILTFSGCNYTVFNNHYCYYNKHFARTKSVCNKIYNGVEFFKEAKAKGVFYCAIWLNFIDSNFLKDFSKKFLFRENAVHQDTDYTPILYTNSQRVFCIHYTPYFRLIRETSATGSDLNKKKMEDKFAVTMSLFNYVIQNEIDYEHPLTTFAIKLYRNYLKIYNYEYFDQNGYFTEIVNKSDELIEQVKGCKKIGSFKYSKGQIKKNSDRRKYNKNKPNKYSWKKMLKKRLRILKRFIKIQIFRLKI